jgi:hypothetical protein
MSGWGWPWFIAEVLLLFSMGGEGMRLVSTVEIRRLSTLVERYGGMAGVTLIWQHNCEEEAVEEG